MWSCSFLEGGFDEHKVSARQRHRATFLIRPVGTFGDLLTVHRSPCWLLRPLLGYRYWRTDEASTSGGCEANVVNELIALPNTDGMTLGAAL